MCYTLGLDIGTNSIGWCALALNSALEPISVAKMGVRIFSDSREDKTSTPLAVARRNARGIRRNLDRRRYKTGTLLRKLVALGFMPQNELECKNLAAIDPYLIRSQAIHEKVPLEHIARALIHISKHRGFKSNRKADKKSKDDGKMGVAIKRLKEQLLLAKCETIGAFLYQKKKNRETVRTRIGKVEVESNKAEGKVTIKDGYEWYIERSMVKHEFDTIMECQKKHHKELTEETINLLDKIIFSQRPLKPTIVGMCSQYIDKYRAPKALPISQEFIMLQKIHDLKINEIDHQRPLTKIEFDKLKNELNRCREKDFKQIRKLLGIENDFNFENEKNKKMQGNITNAIMADKKRFGEAWYKFSDEKKNDIVEMLMKKWKIYYLVALSNYQMAICHIAWRL